MDENKTVMGPGDEQTPAEESNVTPINEGAEEVKLEKPKFVDVANKVKGRLQLAVEGTNSIVVAVLLDLEGTAATILRESDGPVPMDVMQRLVYFLEEEKHKAFQFIAQSYHANGELPEQQENKEEGVEAPEEN